MRIGNRGSVFPLTLLSLFVMSMMGGTVYRMVAQDQFLIKRMMHSAQAEHLAEAGLAQALNLLATDWNNKNSAGNFPLTTMSPGTFDATIVETGGRVLVQSVGTVHNVSKTVSAEVSAPISSAGDYALSGNSIAFNLVGQSEVITNGDIYSNTTISVNAQAGSSEFSAGAAYAGGNAITYSGAGDISAGATNTNASLAVFPTIDFNYYQNIAQNGGGQYYNGNTSFSVANSMPSPAGNVIFVQGDVTISANQTTSACIVATGSITITGGLTTINAPAGYPAMMTRNQPITISGTGNSNPSRLAVNNGLVYSGNNFVISGNHHTVTVNNGSIMALGAIQGNYSGGAHNDLTVNYQSHNNAGFTDTASGFSVKSYTD